MGTFKHQDWKQFDILLGCLVGLIYSMKPGVFLLIWINTLRLSDTYMRR